MAGRTLDLKSVITEDQLGTQIAMKFMEWDQFRNLKIAEWEEVRQYVYATDTTKTTNSQLPWKNKTTVPKLCQIRDNLYANYMASIFPKRKWLIWEGADKDSETRSKREAITNYMNWVISQDRYKYEIGKLVMDYIDYGNCFAMVDWEDQTVVLKDKTQVGYIGPVVKRISPLDIVFNPTANTFENTPKIIRSLVSMGEVKEMLTRFSTDENREEYQALWDYMKGIRLQVRNFNGNLKSLDLFYRMDGFNSFQNYLQSDVVEVLTFYGDLYDAEKDEYLRNHVITVVDRHKVVHKGPNPSYFGKSPMWNCGWRPRQDNLWAMGPLDNLVGMQYRIDHIENLKADVFDLITFPPLKVKGYVEDFEWQPFEKIYVGDDGDVSMMAPPFQVLEANQEIEYLQRMMEEMAGSPKEAMGIRSPGEKTAYEVQRLESAAGRVFQNKISQFEEQLIERLLNGMLELARRRVTRSSIRVFDDELKFAQFTELTADDITGNGSIRPVAARHFAEKAERIQNINTFFQSPLGQDQNVRVHFSGIKLAKLIEDLLELQDYELVLPYIQMAEQADAQRIAQSAQEQVMMEAGTPSGLSQDDFDPDMIKEPPLDGTDQGNAPPMGQAPSGPPQAGATGANAPQLPSGPQPPQGGPAGNGGQPPAVGIFPQ